MTKAVVRVTFAAGLLLAGGLPEAAAQGTGCVLGRITRSVHYDLRTAEPVGWQCHFHAVVHDHQEAICPAGSGGQNLELSYAVTVATPAGDGDPCEFYTPPYTAWCRAAITDASFATTSPSDLVAYPISNTQVGLSWRDNSQDCQCQGADCPTSVGPAWQRFQVERRAPSTGYYVIAILGAGTELVDPGVSPGQTYSYRVQAYDAYGPSPYTNEAEVTPGAPAPPRAVQATVVSSSRVDLGWTDASADEDGFQIERRTGGGAFMALATVGAGATGYSDVTVVAATVYAYRVRAFGASGSSPYATSPTVVTPGGQSAPSGPAAPCCLTAYAQNGNGGPFVQLGWGDQSTDETGFRVERRLPGGTWASIAQLPAGATSLMDNSVARSATYLYRVVAQNAAGASAGTEVQVTTPGP